MEPKFDSEIIVCVKNALPELRQCLASMLAHTKSRFRVILIDDASDQETSGYLTRFCAETEHSILHRNQETLGFTKSLNLGIGLTTSGYIFSVNSDVILTENWDLKLIRALAANERAALSSPLSNAALYQSVPRSHNPDGTYCINSLPPCFDLQQFSSAVAKDFEGQIVSVPILNGFCLCIKRSLIEAIGLFDEVNFPIGYGEETDFCLRAVQRGHLAGIVLDAYVYHHKTRSFSSEERNSLSKAGRDALNRKYGGEAIAETLRSMRNNRLLASVRSHIQERYYSARGSTP